jgi:phospholipase C
MQGGINARTLDYFGWLVASSVFAVLSAVVTAICVKYEARGLAWLWAAGEVAVKSGISILPCSSPTSERTVKIVKFHRNRENIHGRTCVCSRRPC